MKTNYGVLWLNLIISIIMAFSLNNFTELDLYLPVFFLYFASNIAAFFDKYVTYKEMKQVWEECISVGCIVLSAVMVLLYLFHTLNYLEIYFEIIHNEYRMQVRAVPNSFYTFNSKDITMYVFITAIFIPVSYAVLLIAAYLREEGYTLDILKNIVMKKKRSVICCVLTSGVLGGLGVCFCLNKYKRKCEGYGSPQWIKYFVIIFIISILFEFFILMKRNKDIFEQKEKKLEDKLRENTD